MKKTVRANIRLNPGQQEVVNKIHAALPHTELITLTAPLPLGKTTILHSIAAQDNNNRVLGLLDLLNGCDDSGGGFPEKMARLIQEAIDGPASLILVDDYERISRWESSASRSWPSSIPRCDDYLQALVNAAEEKGKSLVITFSDHGPVNIGHRGFCFKIHPLSSRDYEHMICSFLGEEYRAKFDFAGIYRILPLDCFQIKHICRKMIMENEISEKNFLHIAEKYAKGNLSDSFSSSIDFQDLVGLDHAISELRIHVLNPLLHLNHQPENVLLVGSPGVGKSSIGKAISNILGKEKIFLVDGITSSPDNVYEHVKSYLAASERWVRSVIFIDDADVLLEKDYDSSLLRLLLHAISGFQERRYSGSIILTASNAAEAFPSALKRSGRFFTIELNAPAESDRRVLLDREIAIRYQGLTGADLNAIIDATENFTGADLHAVLRFANRFLLTEMSSEAGNDPTRALLRAVDTVKENHRRRKVVGFV